ncbi:2-hydroxyacid dehydrogenase [Herbaspirillum sp. WKF16]|uniref:2-hydroxyacid dehydrogenase n=1 Tax=Herbaspirillum sp. WKF16 TaxID=3028312 RepID=UPI0023A94BB7|nr:2-hydroxyacid dehydrogenase [Herbaspirillum sp. WKF16]WDZ95052.1 2-hydroxyacid dehydrogenase [Herbaspirillum sp. WKF16]
MHKEELLVVTPYPQADMELLAGKYDLHVLSQSPQPERLLAELAPRLRVLATNGESGASAQLIDALPRLEIIVSYGVGVDAIDLAHAAAKGIRVTNTPDVLTGDVADLGIALMLAAARDVARCDALTRAGQWGQAQIPLTTRVFGKRLGIIGLGRVGRAVARRAEAFDMQVHYHDKLRFDDVPYRYVGGMAELAAGVDFLMVCAAADQMPRGAIGREVFDALGADGFLINIARGSIIDEPALLACLERRGIRGAALDVFWNEPAIDPRFLALPNVLLQPHRASATVETRAAMARLVRDNLDAFFSGSALPTEFTMHLARA